MEVVQIRSRMANDVELTIHEMVDEGGISGAFCPNPAGIKTAVRKDSVVISPGLNDVGADFWRDWTEQNKESLFLSTGMLRQEPKEKV